MIPIERWLEVLSHATTKAQATFMYRYINKLGPNLCHTIIDYCQDRLARINDENGQLTTKFILEEDEKL